MKVYLKIILIFFLTGNVYCLFGQDGHYWSQSFGNKSMLLGGTVNASASDLGAVFYNPGRLGLIRNAAFAINAEVYELNTLTVENGVNEGVDFEKKKFGSAPSLAAGSFKIPFLENHNFAYSFLTRQNNETDFFIRVEREGDNIATIPGDELYNGKLRFDSRFKEEWIGLSWSPPISEKVGIGLSNFVSTLNKSSLVGINMFTLDENNKVASFIKNRSYSYDSYGLLWKLGMAVSLSKVNLGLTITTPRINIINSGSVQFEEYLINIDTTGNGETNDAYLYNIQNDLKSTYHSPWAVGLGAGFHFNKVILHFSTEWYSKVSKYSILQTEPFVGQSIGDTVSFQLTDELNSVINFGVGMEFILSEKLTAYASYATDFSAAISDITGFSEYENEAFNTASQANFSQFGGGVSIDTKNLGITVGVIYRGASQEIKPPANFPEEADKPVFESDETSTLKTGKWSFILGFTFPSFDQLLEKGDS